MTGRRSGAQAGGAESNDSFPLTDGGRLPGDRLGSATTRDTLRTAKDGE
jgi:hypothetical protein